MSDVTFKFPDYKHAIAKANELSEVFSFPPVPVLEIAEENGVNVVFANFKEKSETVSGFIDFKKARLYVNRDDMMQRKNFTMAHELGHWILHRDKYTKNPEAYRYLPRFNKVDKNDPLEQEANKFAAHLLVPDHLLIPLIKPVRRTAIVTLANLFYVSRTMMEIRLRNA